MNEVIECGCCKNENEFDFLEEDYEFDDADEFYADFEEAE